MKLVAFDIGNVICHVNLDKFIDHLVTLNVTQDKDSAYEFLHGIQHAQDLGLYNIKQGIYKFNPQISKKTLDELYNAWMEIVTPSQPMLNLIKELIDNGYQVALLSNIGFDHANYVREHCEIFNKCIQYFSCDVGARKPTRLYYQSFILQYGWPNNTLFFDDREDNVLSSKEYLNGVLFNLDDWQNDQLAANHVRNILNDRLGRNILKIG